MKFAIDYPFTKEGVQWFCDDTIDDIMKALESENEINDLNFFISIGNRELEIPCDSTAYEILTDALKEIEKHFNF